jgi:hypothetical protein
LPASQSRGKDQDWLTGEAIANLIDQAWRGSRMSRLTDLLARAKAKDGQLGVDLEREFRALSSRRAFGLNFERHNARWQRNALGHCARQIALFGSQRIRKSKGRDAYSIFKHGDSEGHFRWSHQSFWSGRMGGVIASYSAGTKLLMPKTVWVRDAHNAQASGTLLLKKLLGNRMFPFPKSLYAVEDALRLFVKENREAIILDFFAGSGTTAHAVMRLNRQDGGRRQCISVTNNEVAAEEQKLLREKMLRPGDVEWERWGICDYITKPRIAAAITGEGPHRDAQGAGRRRNRQCRQDRRKA